MRKLNCKEVNEALKNEIMDSYESAEEYYTYDGAEMKTEYNDICKDILKMFECEKLNGDLRYKASNMSKQDLFVEWMSGLPSTSYLGSYPCHAYTPCRCSLPACDNMAVLHIPYVFHGLLGQICHSHSDIGRNIFCHFLRHILP